MVPNGWADVTYDALYRLTKAAYPEGDSVTYGYDAVGNRTVMTDCYGTITYTYDAADQLTGTADTATARPDSATDMTNADFIYDGDGNRIGMSVTGSTYANYTYINDTLSEIARVLVEEDTISGKTNTYFYAGRLIASA